jgi:hypothetical protein
LHDLGLPPGDRPRPHLWLQAPCKQQSASVIAVLLESLRRLLLCREGTKCQTLTTSRMPRYFPYRLAGLAVKSAARLQARGRSPWRRAATQRSHPILRTGLEAPREAANVNLSVPRRRVSPY